MRICKDSEHRPQRDVLSAMASSDRITKTKDHPMGSQGRFAARIRTTALSAMR